MYRKVVSIIILAAFISYLVGCTTMRYVSREDIAEVKQKSVVWVTTSDGNQYKIKEPKVRGSKLIGYIGGVTVGEIDVSEIKSIGIRELNPKRTLLMSAIGVTGAIIVISFLSKGFSSGGEPEPGDRPGPSDN